MGAFASTLLGTVEPSSAADAKANAEIVLPAGAEPSEADLALAVTHMNAFAQRLVHRLVYAYPPNTSAPKEVAKIEREKASPLVVSPLSVYLALSMLTAGATGKTREELQKAIAQRTDKSDADLAKIYGALVTRLKALDDEATLTIANALFASPAIKASYAHLLTTFHAQSCPLTTANAVNAWVNATTQSQIPAIIAELPPGATAVIASANYFHAPWASPFNAKLTTEQKFWLNTPDSQDKDNEKESAAGAATDTKTGEFVRCAMMRAERDDWAFTKTDAFSAVEIPYGGNAQFAALIVVPNADKPGATADTLVDSLLSEASNSLPLKAVLNAVRAAKPARGTVLMPRFRAEYGPKDLVQTMTTLGVHRAFVKAIAEFKGMTDEAVGIDQVLTRAVLDVNEEGTTAAAASATTVATLVKPTPPSDVLMRVDRPFLMFIHDTKLGLMLFAAKINKVPAMHS